MKKILQLKLKFLAKYILAKYKPEIIGITGSVGKTSAKEAIFSALSPKFRVRKNIKNYNNEIGLPLTIIGVESPGKSLLGWIKVFYKAMRLLTSHETGYPQILVLEMGIDRPGDMRYLLDIVKCRAGVVTKIGYSHIEFFGSIEKIRAEKGLLVKTLDHSGWAILNYDDERTMSLANQTHAKILSYGFGDGARVRAGKFTVKNLKQKEKGASLELIYNDSSYPLFLPQVISRTAAYSVLAATAVGVSFGMSMTEIVENLKSFRQPAGRMNLIDGIKQSIIIDDSYNSSPQSSIAALEAMKEIVLQNKERRIAVFGDMLELGSYTEDGHREVGAKAAEAGINVLVLVGSKAKFIGEGARESGMKESDIHYFDDRGKAAPYVIDLIKAGDLILVKGSQGARMEKIVEAIMAEPQKAGALLTRQDKEWQGK